MEKCLEGAHQHVKQQLLVLEHELPKTLVAKLNQYDNASGMRDGKFAEAAGVAAGDKRPLEEDGVRKPSRKFRKLNAAS